MNYIIGLVAALAIVFSLVSFPVPTAIALAVAAVWWLVKGRQRRVE
ncbi:MAG: hypothetical protein HZB72_00210 [Burkholderiales bacterium]|nr:hypothetical protein [Burkholderiales bacterium]